MKIAFLSSEVAPFSKTGGLADVAGALPRFLARAGLEVKVFTPLYRMVKAGRPRLKTALSIGPRPGLERGLTILESGGDPPVYFVADDGYFDRDGLYGTPAGDHPDNAERFAWFCRASLAAMKEMGFRPDVVHGNDWQTGPAFAYLKFPGAGSDGFFARTASVFTIHNLAYQGLFDRNVMARIGLPDALFNMNDLEYFGRVNFLKAGILYSSAVTTVSAKYSREIQTPEFGCGLDGLLCCRSASLHGILNGVDYREWDPMTDRALPANYGPADLSGKAADKSALVKAFGLKAEGARPLAGMVTRLAGQKGLDIVCEALDRMLALGLDLVILGTGEEKIQEFLKGAATRQPSRFGLRLAFDEKLARLIYAGSDMFLIPSIYEPCGLTQMYSLKYGTIPVVRATGGLDDTIVEFDAGKGTGNGYKFGSADAPSLLGALGRAVAAYGRKTDWRRLTANAMASDFSWDRSAGEYIWLYRSLVKAG